MHTRRCGFSVAALLALVVPVVRAPAQTEARSWQTCSLGAIRACNSLFISTTPVFQNFLRVGTNVFVSIQNLQGTNPLDNTGGSALESFLLQYPQDGPPTGFADDGGPTQGIPTGPGASGSGTWGFEAQVTDSYSYYAGTPWLPELPIKGCDDVSSLGLDPGILATCGPQARITFSRFTNVWVDAGLFNAGSISTGGVRGGGSCDLFSGAGGCVLATTATPEPGTLMMLGSGLCLFAGVARRRRKRA